KLTVEVPAPLNASNGAMDRGGTWFIAFDPVFHGFSLDALDSCRFAINGNEIHGDLLPLTATDISQRGSFVYEKAFSHSGQQDITAINQWYCLAVPANLVDRTKLNRIQMWQEPDAGAERTNVFITCDLLEGKRDVAPIAFRQFSWSKGFTINPP